ncbi:23088_t:CDS:2 [Dentiscutata erythropus]|uniref:23088_t:CDS:1 n=1 Tax=Dentiscutata erythropus TaxID=1348616 RepID=A0A9N9D7E8_9GLOM|nr:23088_t:CDS:2 [Dentiscutata erythropus]
MNRQTLNFFLISLFSISLALTIIVDAHTNKRALVNKHDDYENRVHHEKSGQMICAPQPQTTQQIYIALGLW